jgi:hypothetical protein
VPHAWPIAVSLYTGYMEEYTKQPATGVGSSFGLSIPSAMATPDMSDLSLAWVEQNLPRAQMQSVLELAINVFENESVAREWLNQPNLATDERPPIALLGTEEGFLRVQTLLHRIEYGVLA